MTETFFPRALHTVLHLLTALLVGPLLPGLINKVKARIAGRAGPPVLQLYYDLAKLARKETLRSRTTTWVFLAGPVGTVAAGLVASLLVPFGHMPAPLHFQGDVILFAYLFGLARFLTVLSALDTGSSFEGMGAAREVRFAVLCEPALFLGFAALAKSTDSLSLSTMLASPGFTLSRAAGPLMLVLAGWLVVYLAENSRIPVDDPNTHLELTMIHEVMVLDHSGPDFAFILYGAALKLWVLGSLLVNVVLPVRTGSAALDLAAALAGMLCLAVLVGVIESCMARVRLLRVPQLLVGAVVVSGLAFVLLLR